MKEQLEEAAKKYAQDKKDKKQLSNREFDLCKNDFIAGAKLQAERSYSEEDLREAFKQSRQCKIFEKDMPPVYETFEEWFKENKKK